MKSTPWPAELWIGVRRILIPSLRNTSSKAPLNFASRSWIRKRGGEARSASDQRQLARLLGDPVVAWMLGAARDADPAATKAR